MNTSTRYNVRRTIPAWIVLAVFLIVAVVFLPVFRSKINVTNILKQLGPLALAALAQSFAFLVGGIDLSVGAIIGMTTVILSFGNEMSNPLVLIFSALLMGIVVGAMNGMGIAFLKISPLLMTFGSTAIVKGFALLMRGSPGGQVSRSIVKFFGYRLDVVPISAIIVVVFYILAWYWLSFTQNGRRLYAVGDNKESARKAGINVRTTTLLAYILAGLCASLAGILLAARISSGDALIGEDYSIDSITASVIGGMSLLGGVGSIIGSFAGAVLLVISNNILNLFHISTYYQYVVKGSILFIALIISFIIELRKQHEK